LADSIFFTNSEPADGLWSRTANWSTSTLPLSTDTAKVWQSTSSSDPMIVDSSMTGSNAALCYDLSINGASGTSPKAYLDITSGELIVGHNLMIGENGTNAGGVVNISGGQVTIANQLSIGRHGQGVLTMTGGVVEVGGLLGIPSHTSVITSTGSFYLIDGQISCDSLYIPDFQGGKLDIERGKLIISGDVQTRIGNYIESGKITGYGRSDSLNIEIIDGDTVVTAIDPCSLIIDFNNFYPTDGLWFRTSNWTDGKLPREIDVARSLGYTSPTNPMIIDSSMVGSSAAVCYDLSINGASGTSPKAYLDMIGGELIVRNNFMIGENGTNAGGVVNISGGQIIVANQLSVGRHGQGVLTMTGGVVEVAGLLGIPTHTSIETSTGTFNLTDGEIYCDSICMPDEHHGLLDIEQGTLVIDGNYKDLIWDYIESGHIVAYGGKGVFRVDFSERNLAKTTVTALPYGDMNADGRANMVDLAILADCWLVDDVFSQNCEVGDMYPEQAGDGKIDAQDYAMFASSYLPESPIESTNRLLRQGTNYSIWYENPVEKVFKDSDVPSKTTDCIRIKAAKNEFEPFQIVLNPDTTWNAQDVNLVFSDLVGPGVIPSENITIFRVEYVDITETSSDMPFGQLGWNPDPLPPLESQSQPDLYGGENTPYWIEIYVPGDTNSGIYTGNIDIWNNGNVVESNIPIELEIWDFELPTNRNIEIYGTLSHRDTEIMEDLAMHRISFTFPPEMSINVDRIAGEVSVDTDDFNTVGEHYFNQLGHNGYRFPFSIVRGSTSIPHAWPSGSAWYGIPYFSDEVNNILDPEFISMYSQMVSKVSQYLSDNGWLELFHAKILDEVYGSDNIEKCAKVFELIKSVNPNIRTSWTGAEVPSRLWDCVSLWIQYEDEYKTDLHQQRKDAGDDFWVYNNSRMIIDFHYMRIRSFFWHLWNRNLDGAHFWALDRSWDQAWTDPRCATSLEANGNGYFLYGPRDISENPAVKSIRLELIREGIEDYEYIFMLSSLIEEAVQSGVNQNIIDSAQSVLNKSWQITWDASRIKPTDNEPYSKNSDLLYDIRSEIAEQILILKALN
jgi:hypothetical protein